MEPKLSELLKRKTVIAGLCLLALIFFFVFTAPVVFGKVKERKKTKGGEEPLISSVTCSASVEGWNEVEAEKKHPAVWYDTLLLNAEQCAQKIKDLEDKSTPGDAVAITEPSAMTLGKLSELIKKIREELPAINEKVKKKEKEEEAAAEKKWEESLKGDMKKIYMQKGNLKPYVKQSGGTITWTYRSYTSGAIWHECEDYVFTSAGKLKNNKKYKCE